MLDINKLTDYVVELKVIENSNNYDELLDRLSKDSIYYNWFLTQRNNNFEFKDTRKYTIKEIEKNIMNYLKEVI